VSNQAEQRDLRWAREQFPLLARRSDTEVLHIVKEARERLGFAARGVSVSGGVAGFLLGFWIEQKWLTDALPEPGGVVFALAMSFVAGGVIHLIGQGMLRRRIETVASAPRQWN